MITASEASKKRHIVRRGTSVDHDTDTIRKHLPDFPLALVPTRIRSCACQDWVEERDDEHRATARFRDRRAARRLATAGAKPWAEIRSGRAARPSGRDVAWPDADGGHDAGATVLHRCGTRRVVSARGPGGHAGDAGSRRPDRRADRTSGATRRRGAGAVPVVV